MCGKMLDLDSKQLLEQNNMMVFCERDIYKGVDIYLILKISDCIGEVVFKTILSDDGVVRGITLNSIIKQFFNNDLLGYNKEKTNRLHNYVMDRLKSEYNIQISDVIDIQSGGVDKYINLNKFRFEVPAWENDFDKIYRQITSSIHIKPRAYVYDNNKIPFIECLASIDCVIITMFIESDGWKGPMA